MLCASAAVWAAGPLETIAPSESAWVKAVIGRDTAALDRILTPDLIYAHASGVVDTKTSYIDKLKSGRQVYKTLEQRKMSARLHGDTIVTHCWVHVTGTNPQGAFDDKVMMMHVWVKHGGQWRLAAHQTTRVDALP